MNFLAHYAILKDRDQPAFTTGKIFPDLLRAPAPKARLRIEPVNAEWPDDVQALTAGINVHLETDQRFHDSAFFHARLEALKVHLVRLNLSSIQRFRFFYAHILVELLLDRWLMQDHPGLLSAFYDQIHSTKNETITTYLRYIGQGSVADSVLQHVRRFVDTAYLHGYLKQEGIVFALDRIAQRVSLPVITKPDSAELVNALPAWEAEIRPGYSGIFEDIEKALKR